MSSQNLFAVLLKGAQPSLDLSTGLLTLYHTLVKWFGLPCLKGQVLLAEINSVTRLATQLDVCVLYLNCFLAASPLKYTRIFGEQTLKCLTHSCLIWNGNIFALVHLFLRFFQISFALLVTSNTKCKILKSQENNYSSFLKHFGLDFVLNCMKEESQEFIIQ